MNHNEMKKMTAEEFKEAIGLDPAWASMLTEDIEITTYCDMQRSEISHLSKHLHFTGRYRYGESASFWGCKDLEVAEGNFDGSVDFACSGIKTIDREHLKINGTDVDGYSAFFLRCNKLKVATGNFPGFVDFQYSAIEKIEKLTILKKAISGMYEGKKANFSDCSSLTNGPEYLLGKEYIINTYLRNAITYRRVVKKSITRVRRVK